MTAPVPYVHTSPPSHPDYHQLDNKTAAPAQAKLQHLLSQPHGAIVRDFLPTELLNDNDAVSIEKKQRLEAHTTNVWDTLEHQSRVANHFLLIARRAQQARQLSDRDITIGYVAAFFHDVGKFALPADVVFKEGLYTEAEYEQVKEHAPLAQDIITKRLTTETVNSFLRHKNESEGLGLALLDPKNDENIPTIASLAAQHHELCDGKGYPNNLDENKLSTLARALTIADVYDALTNKRVYRPHVYTHDGAISLMQGDEAAKFDQPLVTVLARVYTPAPQPIRPLELTHVGFTNKALILQ